MKSVPSLLACFSLRFFSETLSGGKDYIATVKMTSSQDEFTIHVEGKTIICDKTILREGSEYFRAMFDSNMIESKSNETTLQEQSYDIVKTLIHSLKTGELEIGDNVEELVEGAVMLQV